MYRHAAGGGPCPGQPFQRYARGHQYAPIGPTETKRKIIHKTGSIQRIVTPPDEDRATALGDKYKKFSEDGSGRF